MLTVQPLVVKMHVTAPPLLQPWWSMFGGGSILKPANIMKKRPFLTFGLNQHCIACVLELILSVA